jgi:uncharacterized membrane protein
VTDEPNAPQSQRLLGFLAAVGVLLSAWLWVLHVRTYLAPSASSFCSFNAQFDCTEVAASRYSVFLGVPWAAHGLVGFLALSVLIWRRSILALPLSALMSAGSVGLLLVEVLQVGSICLWCEAVHLVAWALTLGLFLQRESLVRDERNPLTLQLGVVLPLTLLITFAAFLPRYWGAMSYKAPPTLPTGVTSEGYPWIGSPNPRVTLHEFIDYRCPHCQVASTHTLRKLARSSDVRLVRRHQPRMTCDAPVSCDSFRLALCAAKQGKFWQADRYLFEVAGARKSVNVASAAEALKLDVAKLEACFAAPETWAEAKAEAKAARKLKILTTPGYIVDGKRLTLEQAMRLF